ncbi:hypothetical protein QNM99_28040 [Pseudomonas sp. PCH446]
MKLILAEWVAYLIQITIWGISIDALTANYGWVVVATKILAVIFLFYISLKLWFSVQLDTSGKPSAISVSALFLATLTNPKGLFFASFVAPAEPSYTGKVIFHSWQSFPWSFFRGDCLGGTGGCLWTESTIDNIG